MIREIFLENKKNLLMLFVVLITSSLIPITVFKIGNFGVKLLYLVSFFILVLMIFAKRLVLPSKKFLVFVTLSCFISVILGFYFGISRLFFNYLFGIFVISVICSFGKNLEKEDFVKVFSIASGILAIAILINNVLQYKEFSYYFANFGWIDHPVISTLVAGGINIEASWVALLGITHFDKKTQWPYFTFSIVLSAIYASRVGMIINFFVLIAFFANFVQKRGKVALVTIGLIFSAIIIIMAFGGVFEKVIERFLTLGSSDDKGAMGRLALWKNVPKFVVKYPFGVGLGNSLTMMEETFDVNYYEDNIHNLFFQMICEIGILGGLFYLILIGLFVKDTIKRSLKDPFVLIIYMYIIVSFLQFKGAETIMFCIIGTYMCLNEKGINFCEVTKKLKTKSNKVEINEDEVEETKI